MLRCQKRKCGTSDYERKLAFFGAVRRSVAQSRTALGGKKVTSYLTGCQSEDLPEKGRRESAPCGLSDPNKRTPSVRYQNRSRARLRVSAPKPMVRYKAKGAGPGESLESEGAVICFKRCVLYRRQEVEHGACALWLSGIRLSGSARPFWAVKQ